MRNMEKANRKNWLFWSGLGLFLAAFLALSILFPYSGDDWYWACEDFSLSSLTLLNGRYLGTVFVLLMTHYAPLRVIFTAGTIGGILFLLARKERKNSLLFLLAAVVLFLLMPVDMFRQVVVWTSGFANYTPSVLILVVYLYLIRGIFRENTAYPVWMSVIFFALGFAGGLFMENMTIGNVIIAAAVVIYLAIRYHHVPFAHIAFLIGTVAGAALMFTNGAYFEIIGGEGDSVGYRDFSFGLEMITQIKDNYFSVVYPNLVYKNVWLNIAVTALLLALSVKNFLAYRRGKQVLIGLLGLFEIAFLLISAVEKMGGSLLPYFGYVGALKGLLCFLYLIAVFWHAQLVLSDNGARLECLFLFGCMLAYVVPLLVVSPLGARNFFETYILLIAFVLLLLRENLRLYEVREDALAVKIVVGVLAVVAVALFIRLFVVYGTVYAAYTERAQSVLLQIESGNSEISVEALPYSDYVWNGDPYNVNSYLQSIFKAFYGIDDSVTLTLLE